MLEAAVIDDLFARVNAYPGYTLSVQLAENRILDDHGLERSFEIDPFRKHCLLNGLDDIALTLEHADRIADYEARRGMVALSESAGPH